MSTWLIDTALYTGFLIALVLVLRGPVAKHFGPTMAYALWALPLLRFVLPPLVLPASFAPAPDAAPVTIEPAILALMLAADQASTAAVVAPSWQWTDLILPLWLGSATVFLAWRMRNYLKMRSMLLAEAKPVGEAGKVRLVETPAVVSPIAFGVFDKVVALPPRFMVMEDRHARDFAIAHELAHHAGHDIAANFAAQPLLALHWFNPIAWAGWRAMRRDQEAACDARVLAGRDRAERAAYADVIAGFAAGPRLELAAPMACPMIGEKSIIHRLRSLSMTEVPHRRRMTGRLLLGAAALAVPLTASVSYAQAGASGVEEVEVGPSEVGSDQPAAEKQRVRVLRVTSPDGANADDGTSKDVKVFRFRRGGDGSMPDGDPHVFSFTTDKELTEEQKKRLDEMVLTFEKHGAEWEKQAKEFAKMAPKWEAIAEEQRTMALALAESMPRVVVDCDRSGGERKREIVDENGQKTVVICARQIERQARLGAMTGLRSARAAIAGNRELDAEIRDEILRDLDAEIRRIESETRGS